MNRRALLSTFIAMAMVSIMAFVAGSNRAEAQAANCCTYTLKVNLPDFCCPFVVTTRWSTGIISYNVPQLGVYTAPVPPPCPPGPVFGWVSFDGGVTTYGLGTHLGVAINGCTATVKIGFDANGCIVISIS